MAQLGYPGSAPLVDTQHMALSLCDMLLPEQPHFLSPIDDYHLCQQRTGLDYHIFEPVLSPGNSAGSMNSIYWEEEQTSHQSSEAAVMTTPGHSPVSWAPRSEDWSENWSSYQELQHNLQQPQPAFFSQSAQCPTPADSPLAMDAARQTATSGRTGSEPDSRTTITKKVAISVKEPPEPHRSSTAQRRTKRARVEAGSEHSLVTPISYNDNEGENSDISQALRGLERKKTHRVKSRAAAKRCREKTKQYETNLANREEQIIQKRIYLDAWVTALKNEVLALRIQILEHSSCDCEMIQGYIARTACSVVYNGYEVPAMLPSLI